MEEVLNPDDDRDRDGDAMSVSTDKDNERVSPSPPATKAEGDRIAKTEIGESITTGVSGGRTPHVKKEEPSAATTPTDSAGEHPEAGKCFRNVFIYVCTHGHT